MISEIGLLVWDLLTIKKNLILIVKIVNNIFLEKLLKKKKRKFQILILIIMKKVKMKRKEIKDYIDY